MTREARESHRRQQIQSEQDHLSTLYERLDESRERTDHRLREVHARGGRGTMQALVERDAAERESSRRLSRLSAADYGLCFGRLDFRAGEPIYIGRISLLDEKQDPLLIDWRAPAAEGFYRATPATPQGVVRRRQIRTRGRTVTALHDEVFDPHALSAGESALLDEESALFASLEAGRTGRMRDIVATVQAEQDRIVRADLPGIMVVQGGPGTGKTVVALHRAAYLLYTHRARLAKSGVLIIGPNPTFMRYIDQVLPSLGENDVLLSSIGQLYPGVDATAAEAPATAAAKGDPRMAPVLAAAVRARQRLPERALAVTVNRGTMHEEVVRLDVAQCERAREQARLERLPHNQAREIFIDEIIEVLSGRLVGRMGTRRFEGAEDPGVLLRSDPDVAAAIESLWPGLRPQRFLAELLASEADLVAAGLDEAAAAALHRPGPPTLRWTPADVPLLDEAAELLGPLKSVQAILGEQAAIGDVYDELAYAEETLAELGIETVNAEQLLTQHEGEVLLDSTAERAAVDRTWAFGHVIVDEAQELSPMAWRVLMRRCPSRSMTVVGDIAQTGSAAGAGAWADVLDPYAAGRWRQEHLTLNYRSTGPIMAVAAEVLAGIDASLSAPAAVRLGGEPPWSVAAAAGGLAPTVADLVRHERRALAREVVEGLGRVAVIAPPPAVEELCDQMVDAARAGDEQALDAAVVVLTVEQSKGLEFDAVVLVEPAAIVAGGGPRDLYVAVTRATRRLGVVHTGELPGSLRLIAPRAGLTTGAGSRRR